jgi:Ca2+-binding EF-hand superfamily protein
MCSLVLPEITAVASLRQNSKANPYMKNLLLTLAICAVAFPLFSSHAQEGRPFQAGGRGFGGERGEGGMARRDATTVALDTNNDGVIDEKEISEAPAALKKLDRNADGKLTQDELRPAMPMPGQMGPGPGQANTEETVTRMMQYDKDSDGKLSKEELPERMQNMVERGDTNKDGFLTRDELRALSATQGSASPNRGRGEGRNN